MISFRETLGKYSYIKIATLIAFTPLVSYAIEKEDITLQIKEKKVNKEQPKQIKIGKVYDEELLKLLLITFLGNQDLENAYIVAKKRS
ncbi:hypothetical protein [Sulfurihydrogenibium sp.]|jgi:hypothetical protein|uniref:hypothetical protein n=1 Tax=Sulfurihydrogenibium sp. TaxID=2053621 RepID=UPI002601B4A5|nr:hypothetical protein [Sulfurihydrogenibium sp.]